MIDFGLAVFAESSVSLTAPHMVVGTPSCMPPEQANGEKPLTPAVDVYALGAVLLFAASGHAPYRADNIHLLFHQVVDPACAPDLSGTPDELVRCSPPCWPTARRTGRTSPRSCGSAAR
ncbi:hypothetical protein GCM10023238_11350 [Streptomyces heliomycini]